MEFDGLVLKCADVKPLYYKFLKKYGTVDILINYDFLML
ncbi:hypothetical protein HMPREF9978_09436 [Staphylococcus epidermidis NIHLM015]|nr:hypothetical protein HMPREF9978_09436 [Staphylococcus epidermidis NIHLM015]